MWTWNIWLNIYIIREISNVFASRFIALLKFEVSSALVSHRARRGFFDIYARAS